MTFKEIQELIKLVNKTNLSELKLKDGNFEIQIRSKEYIKNKAGVSDSPQIISVAPSVQSPQTPVLQAAPAGEALPTESKATSDESSNANLLEVKSPIVGTFYRSSSPDKPAFVKVGDTIEAGDVVCIVEAMKLFNEIESEISGKIVKVLVEDASPVEYDQPLFLVEPA
jgi:acetyl-CoA carboxylase biotin carboxyl carrier protein